MSLRSVALLLNRECVRCPEQREGQLSPVSVSTPRVLHGARWFNGHLEIQCQLGCVPHHTDHIEFVTLLSYSTGSTAHTRRITLGALSGQHIAAVLVPAWISDLRCHVGLRRCPYPPYSPQEHLLAQHVVAMLLHDVGPCSVPVSELQNMMIALPFYDGAVGPRRGGWGRFLLRWMNQCGMWHCFKYTLEELSAHGMEHENHQEYRIVHACFRDGVAAADHTHGQACSAAKTTWSTCAAATRSSGNVVRPTAAVLGILQSSHYNTLTRTHARKMLEVFAADPHLVVLFDPYHPIVVQRRRVLIDGQGKSVAQLASCSHE